MSYKVLSLKWRPQTFDDIVGQDHVTKTLTNAFKLDRVAQGYMFTGPRGVGKTTTARILSRALNAEGGPKFDFDPSTKLSIEIAEGRALDVLEIDGASNRGIEEIRNLREQIKFAPMVGSYKVIIIDEVHMLTNPAFNALLRTLEEPPEHGKFIFCTTDIHKVPATIISRCQRFDFNRIATDTIIARISYILKQEAIDFDLDSLQLIARKADGSMRDALSILDQVISFCGSEITSDKTVLALGVIPNDLYFNYSESILNNNGNQLVDTLDSFLSFGVPAEEVISGVSNHLKNLLYSKIDRGIELLDMNEESKKRYISHSSKWDRRDLLRSIQILTDVSSHIRRSDDPYLLLEFTSLKLLEMDKSVSIERFLSSETSVDENSKNKVKESKISQKKTLSDNTVSDKIVSSDSIDISNNKDINDNLDNSIIVDKETKSIDVEKSLVENTKIKIQEEKNDIEKDSDSSTVTDKQTLESEETVIELETVIEKWQHFIDNTHIKKPSIASILDKSKPIDVSGLAIIFEITSALDFHLSMIEKNRDNINDILAETFGPGVSFKVQKNTENEVESAEIKTIDNETNHERDEQVRDKVVDLFDGEILT